jgi:hypothetical protein
MESEYVTLLHLPVILGVKPKVGDKVRDKVGDKLRSVSNDRSTSRARFYK